MRPLMSKWLGEWVRPNVRPSVMLCLLGTLQTTVFAQ